MHHILLYKIQCFCFMTTNPTNELCPHLFQRIFFPISHLYYIISHMYISTLHPKTPKKKIKKKNHDSPTNCTLYPFVGPTSRPFVKPGFLSVLASIPCFRGRVIPGQCMKDLKGFSGCL